MNVSLLRRSFDMVLERQPLLVRRFYDILFARYPQAQRLFAHTDRVVQERRLSMALVAVMEHLEDAPWFRRTLGALGEKHKGYGVTDEMYGWVGECLLAAMAEAAGPDWTPQLEAEWSAAYGAIAGAMQGGRLAAQSAA
jgi:hemoglobin-like flavoprotein